jgi:hypothetical protein
MKIENVSLLPDLATRTQWARLTDRHTVSFARAEAAGLLTSYRPNCRTILYRKEDVLRWLGIPVDDASGTAAASNKPAGIA